jgi:hypothetical protein
MNYVAQCLEKFRRLPENIKEILGGLDALLVIKKLEDVYNISLSFLVVLVAIGEVSLEDIPGYLKKKYGFSEEDAFDLQNELTRKIFSFVLVAPSVSVISESAAEGILSEGINGLLADSKKAQEFNEGLFGLFSKNGLLPDKLSKNFVNNQERLTSGSILSEGKEVAPTVANWLKDFISVSGSGIFDDLALIQYLSNSSNVKRLDEKDKNLLRRLLRLYRNLVFFPNSMGNLPVEDWEIIPIDKKEDEKKIREDVLAAPSPKATGVRILSAAASPLPDKLATLTELEKMLPQYPAASLEHKAVSQEISRFKKAELKKTQKAR